MRDEKEKGKLGREKRYKAGQGCHLKLTLGIKLKRNSCNGERELGGDTGHKNDLACSKCGSRV